MERSEEMGRRLERARWPRYTEGWQLYLDAVNPIDRAAIVVDNDDFSRPVVISDR